MRIRAAWRRFWLAPSQATNLGVVRIAASAALLIRAGSFGREAGPPWLEAIFRIALWAALAGLGTRISLFLAVAYAVVMGAPLAILLVAAIAALSPAGDGLALDAWIRAFVKPSPSRERRKVERGAYRWPVQAARIVLCFAGLAAGIAWMNRHRWSGAVPAFPETLLPILIDWPAVAARVRLLGRRIPAIGTGKRHAILYDGACGLCQRSALFLRRFDFFGRIEWIDVRFWEAVQRRFPALDRARCMEELHVVRPDGAVRAGFDAYRSVLWILPGLAPLAPFLYIPGVAGFGRRIYREIAGRRAGFFCPIDADR